MVNDIIKWTSPFITDNVLLTLDALLCNKKIEIRRPEGVEGLEMSIDAVRFLMFLCWGYKDYSLDLYLNDNDYAHYYTGYSKPRQEEFEIKIKPAPFNFEEVDQGFYLTYIYGKEKGKKYITFKGKPTTWNIRNKKLHDNWFLLMDLKKYIVLSYPPKECMINISTKSYEKKKKSPLDAGLFYYSRTSKENPNLYEISSKEKFIVSEPVYAFLMDTFNQKVQKREHRRKLGKP